VGGSGAIIGRIVKENKKKRKEGKKNQGEAEDPWTK
jgi:hypothetical protein